MQVAMITAHDRKAEKTTWSSQGSSCIKPGFEENKDDKKGKIELDQSSYM